MVNGKQSQSQRRVGLPFTVYCLLHALRYVLCDLTGSKDHVFDVEPDKIVMLPLGAVAPDGHRYRPLPSHHILPHSERHS
jgi:hypothetical protein